MKLKVAWVDFEKNEIGLAVPDKVMASRSWGKGEVDIDLDDISEVIPIEKLRD
jgi:hypothetical protein